MRICLRLILIQVFWLVSVFPSLAFDRRMGARSMGMGDAFTALADDTNTLNYNPAGVVFESASGFSLEYANLYYGLTEGLLQENHFAYCRSIDSHQGFGVVWNNRSLANVYTENEWILGYATQPMPDWPFWAGLSAKFFYVGYTDSDLSNNPFFTAGHEKYQYGLDAGLLYRVWDEQTDFPSLQVGLGLFDLNQPDLGLRSEARQPLEIRTAAAGYYRDWDSDLELVFIGSQPQLHLGVEKWFQQKKWGVRGGVITGAASDTTWTLGGSYGFEVSGFQFRLHYAYNFAFGSIQDTLGIHRLSLDMPWRERVVQASEGPAKVIVPSDKITRIKAYLTTRIDTYLALTQKLDQLKQGHAPAQNLIYQPVEAQLHEAVGALVLTQDIVAFLKLLTAAENAFRNVSTAAPGAP